MIICPECASDEVSGGNHGYQGWCCVECGYQWPMAGSVEIVTEPEDLVLITFERSDAVMQDRFPESASLESSWPLAMGLIPTLFRGKC